MDKLVGRVLRSDEVKLEGQVQLQMKQPKLAAQPSSYGPQRVKIGTAQSEGKPQNAGFDASIQSCTAVIVENRPEFAVIEITCRCGTKIYLRCEYTDVEAQTTEASDTKDRK